MRSLFVVFSVIISFSSFGQVWGNPGATWHYDFGLFMGGLYTVTYESDTIIQNYPAQKLSVLRQEIYPLQNGTTVVGNEYTYSQFTRYSGDSVFWFSDNEFHLLYDFGALPGDSWIINQATDSMMMCDTTSIVEVIDTGHVQINGLNLRYLDLRYVQGNMGVSGRAVERMGLVQGYNPEMSFLFPRDHNCDSNVVVDFWLYHFRCYTDNNFTTYNVNSVSCDYPVATASLPEIGQVAKEVFKMYDLLGREVQNPKGEMVIVQYTDGSTEKVFFAD